MEDNEIIISGPEFSGSQFSGSFAENVIPRMKSRPKDLICQVECATKKTITTFEFLKQSLEIAEGLNKFGLQPEDLVILAGNNNIQSHVAAMGIVLGGGAFCPIDQSMKKIEIQYIFKQFKPKYIMCETEDAEKIQVCVKEANLDTKIILMDSTAPSGGFFCWEDVRTNVDVDSYVPRKVADQKKTICLVNCSSGSTGMPKGVATSHYSLLRTLAVADTMAVSEVRENFLLTSPIFWVSGTSMLFHSCFFGNVRYTPVSLDPGDLLDAIEESKPPFVMLAPNSLLTLVRHENFKKRDISSVKNAFSLGAPLSPAIATQIKEAWKGIAISNFYGLTEVGGGILLAYNSDVADAIGKPLQDLKLKVVDVETGQSLGPNKIGELRIKTSKIMIGYYNNEEATKDTFDENGWFCTRDLVHYDENHMFYFVCRVQETILYHTYKIPPAEIEAFIMSLPGVKDVAIVPVPHEVDGNHLRALVVKSPNSDITAERIIREVQENLSDRKRLRGGVQFVDYVPRSVVGKLKRLEAIKMIQMD